MCGGNVGKMLETALPAVAGSIILPGIGTELGMDLSAGLGGAIGGGIGGLTSGGGLVGTAEGALGGYGTGNLLGGLGTMGSDLVGGSSIGSAFSDGFPTIAGIGKSIENGASSLGSGISSMFGGTPASSGITWDTPDLGTANPLGGPSPAAMADGLGNGTVNGASTNPLIQSLASQAASQAGGASNTLGSMFNSGDTLGGMSTAPTLGGSPMGATSAGSNLAAGGGGTSAFSNLGAGGASAGSMGGAMGGTVDPTSMISQSAIQSGLQNTAAPAAATGGSGMNLGSILSGVSGLANAYTNNKEANQLAAGQKLNQQQMAPFLSAGTSAAGNLTNLLNPGTSQSALANTPGYQFELQQGNNALNNQMAASGMTGSGAALKAAQQFGQGLAGTTYQNAISNALSGSQLGTQAGAINSTYNTALGNIGAGSTGAQTNNILASLAGIFGGKQSGLNSFSF